MRRRVPTEALISIGTHVRRGRERLGLTQEELAEGLDIAVRYVQQIERGVAGLSLALFLELADYLKVKPQSLLRPAPRLPAVIGRPKRR